MKNTLAVIVLLMSAASALAVDEPVEYTYGAVRVYEDRLGSPRAIIEITAWATSLPTDIDSALDQHAQYTDGIHLHISDCRTADPDLVREAAGRFTQWKLREIVPTGAWQWDRPLVIQLPDSTACPIFMNFRERRWTSVVIGDSTEQQQTVYRELLDLIRRYKREQVDRMEEMFRK
jgi:hypothetical protein